jgi:esterase/lipase superfamily enzyme
VLSFVLSVRNANYDGPVVPATLTQPPGSLALLQGCASVVFLVHGFNVTATDGAAVLPQFGHPLTSLGADAAAVSVLWPGHARIGPLCYPFETNNADDSAVELSKFIQVNLSHCPRISFVSHSLGARVVMQTIQQLRIMEFPWTRYA